MKVSLPLSSHFIQSHGKKFLPLIERYAREKAIHNTLLVTGLEGVGKKEAVLYFVQYLFCDLSVFATNDDQPSMLTPEPSPTPGITPCGECKSCKRALQNQWLDLFWFDPETNEEETRIGQHKIETFRELKSKFGLGPMEEPFKVVVITDADRMTPQAANSILKMLEEPPENWIFILTAGDASRLLPTILSRCIELKLSPLTSEQIFNILKDQKGIDFQSAKAEVASKAAQGSISRAHYFMDDETWKTREVILGLLSSPTHEWMRLVELLSQSQRELILGLDLLESIFTDLLNAKIYGASSTWIHHDQKEFLLQWMEAKKITIHKITYVMSELAEKRRFTSLTLNSKLLSQEVLIPLLQVIL